MPTKHTPETYTHQVTGGKTEGIALGDNGWARIEGGTFEQRHARARLIAAAPDLAAALIGIIQVCPECSGAGVYAASRDRITEGNEYAPCPWCAAARAALVKAGVLE